MGSSSSVKEASFVADLGFRGLFLDGPDTFPTSTPCRSPSPSESSISIGLSALFFLFVLDGASSNAWMEA